MTWVYKVIPKNLTMGRYVGVLLNLIMLLRFKTTFRIA